MAPTNLLLSALGVALGLAAAPARASSIETRLEVFDREAVAIARVVDDLRQQLQPSSILSPSEAARRFEEAVFMHMVGEPGPAAEHLYTLLSTDALTDPAMRRDAQWTYAEALLAMGHHAGAAEQFELVVRDGGHPFRDDAVRKLLECYAAVRDRAAFEAVYRREVASGRVEPTGHILYALGKGRYVVGDLDGAERAFDTLDADDPYRGRAEYFTGVIATRRGELARAQKQFEGVAERPIVAPVDQQVRDQALLALGRLHYHAGRYHEASSAYARVSPDSEQLDDKLYEMIWSSIRQARWPEAIDNVEIFLMVFPDHEYAAQLLLLRGHLHVQAEDWDSALATYEQVIRDYRPVHQRFESLAQPGSRAEAEVREVIERLEGAAGLPSYAVAMLREDPLFQRAITVVDELRAQRTALDASERLVDDLAVFLRADGLGSFTSMRVRALHQRAQIVEQRLGLLRIQEDWLAGQPGVEQGLVTSLMERRGRLETELAGVSGPIHAARRAMDDYEAAVGSRRARANRVREQLDAMGDELVTVKTRLALQAEGHGVLDESVVQTAEVLKGRIETHRQELAELESAIVSMPVPQQLDGVPSDVLDATERAVDDLARRHGALWPAEEAMQLLLARIDTTHQVLHDGYAELGEVLANITRAGESELGRLREQFEAEASEVGRQRRAHETASGEVRALSLRLTRDGFGRLEDFFASSMRKADMGIVDVHWARKLERSDLIDQVRADREAITTELARRFELIRAKLGRPPTAATALTDQRESP